MAVPQVETPFLKVTAEDSVRFGIAPTPIAPPTVRVEAATAETLAAAEPEGFRDKIVQGPTPAAFPLRIPVPTNGNGGAPTAPAAPAADRAPIAARQRQQAQPASLSNLHRTERACPPLREFQPQPGRPFRLAHRTPQRLHAFRSRSARRATPPGQKRRAVDHEGKLRRRDDACRSGLRTGARDRVSCG
jgi:hypothetical protein